MSNSQTLQNVPADPFINVSHQAQEWSGPTTTTDFAAVQNIGQQLCKHKIVYNRSDQNRSRGIGHNEDCWCQNYVVPPMDVDPTYAFLKSTSTQGDKTTRGLTSLSIPPTPISKYILPAYFKPLPQHMGSADIEYLCLKGALSLPDISLRNALFRSYLEFVHPFMPFIEIYGLTETIEKGPGASGPISLLLFQAIMFAGTAFVDMECLRHAGYTNRQFARKTFFQRARVSAVNIQSTLVFADFGRYFMTLTTKLIAFLSSNLFCL